MQDLYPLGTIQLPEQSHDTLMLSDITRHDIPTQSVLSSLVQSDFAVVAILAAGVLALNAKVNPKMISLRVLLSSWIAAQTTYSIRMCAMLASPQPTNSHLLSCSSHFEYLGHCQYTLECLTKPSRSSSSSSCKCGQAASSPQQASPRIQHQQQRQQGQQQQQQQLCQQLQ